MFYLLPFTRHPLPLPCNSYLLPSTFSTSSTFLPPFFLSTFYFSSTFCHLPAFYLLPASTPSTISYLLPSTFCLLPSTFCHFYLLPFTCHLLDHFLSLTFCLTSYLSYRLPPSTFYLLPCLLIFRLRTVPCF